VFEAEEKPALTPLPSPLPERFTWSEAKVDTTCHVYFDKSHYSVPYRYVGRTLLIKAGRKIVEIYDEAVRVAVHLRATRPGMYRTELSHYPPEKRGPVEMTQDRCLATAAQIGPHTQAFVALLLEDKCVRRLPAVRGVLSLAKKYEIPRLEAACKRALDYGLTSYSAVKRVLEDGLEDLREVEDDATRREYLAFVPNAKFGRSIGALMAEAVA
jgi:hypothetical protein